MDPAFSVLCRYEWCQYSDTVASYLDTGYVKTADFTISQRHNCEIAIHGAIFAQLWSML
jgi:hypothetical protein